MDNYFDLEENFTLYNKVKVVILPIPFDKSCSWLKGAKKGPEAILQASHQVELFDIETQTEVYKTGITSVAPIVANTSEAMVHKAYKKTLSLLQDEKFVVTLGGDHSVSIGPIKAYAETYADLSILHLDAHADTREIYENNPYSHACVMARANEVVDNIVSVGIRSMGAKEMATLKAKHIVFAHEMFTADSNWIDSVVKALSKTVYISIDVDVFEIGLMPATGTPEPGGLGWYQVLDLLKAVTRQCKVVGFDVVELSPMPPSKAPDFLCAKLIYKLLSYVFVNTN